MKALPLWKTILTWMRRYAIMGAILGPIVGWLCADLGNGWKSQDIICGGGLFFGATLGAAFGAVGALVDWVVRRWAGQE